ncbi:hypothetical protein GW766_01000 [Candidatus Parcubacteria bacterium]|nr:hypothetical protein [Candidatus Parcubacteria bacterium]
MSENETLSSTEAETVTEVAAEPKKKKSRANWLVAATMVVVVIIFGVLYLLEKEGRSSTTIFSSIIEQQEAKKVVATVNGEDITNAELKISIEQFSQMATAQGVDAASPEVQTEIRTQALEVLVNTKLLKQEAATQGISVTDEEVNERLTALTEELGGEEVLTERMTSLGIDDVRLHSDIKDELTIKKLLNTVFAEANIVVTDEEVASVYEAAGGEAAGLPAIDEVRSQIEAQISSSKEQAAIDEFLTTIKEGSAIEIIE